MQLGHGLLTYRSRIEDLASARITQSRMGHYAAHTDADIGLGHPFVDMHLDSTGCRSEMDQQGWVAEFGVHAGKALKQSRSDFLLDVAVGHLAVTAQGHHDHDVAIAHPDAIQARYDRFDQHIGAGEAAVVL
ncbi:hypothetical protein SDC9_210870 [bioreactor metagenome]|uniref:Uncharacterized protein n=1 Tax=bioreactor metagenome TaxID=1076179 RepID=A0A645JI59_9ZZZZ